MEKTEEGSIWSGFLPIELVHLANGLPPSCDLYIEQGGRLILYREASLPFTPQDCARLDAAGVQELWFQLSSETGDHSEQPLATLLSVSDEQLPPAAKATLLYMAALSIAQKSVRSTITPEALNDARELVTATVAFLAQSPSIFPAVLGVLRHDFALYTHAVNVSIYALGLARFTGISNRHDLELLGLGAFLHDVGKAQVPKSILNKRGPLSSDEWAVIRKHPTWGRDILAKAGGVPETVITVVVQHHERLDGSGYPGGLAAEDLHHFSLLVAIADSFDALTSTRPYREAYTPFAALSVLRGETDGRIDRNLFKRMVQLLRDPLGSPSAPALAS